MALSVSSAKVDITPTPSENPYLGGYGGPDPRTVEGTFSPLYARCLVLWDGDYPNVIVSLDVLAISRPVHQEIRDQVLALNDLWGSSDFVLSATHTHNGPVLTEELDPYIAYGMTDLSEVTSYVTSLTAKVVALVEGALAATPTPCTLSYKVTSRTFSANREGLSYNETAVPVLVARATSGGQRKAVLFSYGCHPVSAGFQSQWDGDYPAGACSTIEAAIPGCFAIYVQGPAGDQDPIGTRGWTLRNTHASQLGNAVVTASNTAGRALTGPVMTSYSDVSLPLDITDTPANLAALIGVYQARQANGSLPVWYHRHAEKMIDEINSHTFATTVPLPVQVWKLQGSPILRMAFVGGELVSGYAVYFRGIYGGNNGLIVSGYANETPGYIPSNELLPPIRTGGSYGGGWDTDFPGVAGGSMTVYGCLGRFKAGSSGVENALITALDDQLS